MQEPRLPYQYSSHTYQHGRCSKQITERIVHKVEEGSCIDICVSHYLTSKECLPRTTSKQATRHTVACVHIKRSFTYGRLNISCIGSGVTAAVQCSKSMRGRANVQTKLFPEFVNRSIVLKINRSKHQQEFTDGEYQLHKISEK